MAIKKINKKVFASLSLAMVIAFIGHGVDISYGSSKLETPAAPGSENDRMLFNGPSYGIAGDYEEEARATVKVDGVLYKAYLKTQNGNGYINHYPTNAVWGLKMNAKSNLYYSPNLSSTRLTQKDASSGVVSKIPGIEHSDNGGDVYWNYYVRRSKYVQNDDAGKIGALDLYKNFKPAYQETNRRVFGPLNLKYPTQWDNKILGTAEGEGQALFYGNKVGSSSKYSGALQWRNNSVKDVVGNSVVRGEWRNLGANTGGGIISNPNFPIDQGKMENINSNYKLNWNKIVKTGYNSSDSEQAKYVRESTFSRLSNSISTGINKNNMNDYFSIGVPATSHISGIVTGYRGVSQYTSISIPSDYVLDLELSKVEILDAKGKSIYTMSQSTGDEGVKDKSEVPSTNSNTKVKLQPGYQYTLKVTIKNRANKKVYNPTFNVLGAIGADATNTSYNLVDKGSNASGYWTYSYTTLQEKREFGKSLERFAGYFSVNGDRNKKRGNQKDVPAFTSEATINPLSSKTISIPFIVEAPKTKSELEKAFNVSSPNNVRIRLAASINPKHSISDDVFRNPQTGGQGTGIAGVQTSIDNLYTQNDSLAMSKAFYTQDMSIGTTSEYKIYDENGAQVKDNTLVKGKDYTIKVPVKNNSGVFGTSMKSKIDYSIIDANGNKVVSTSSASGTRSLGVNDSETVSFKVRIPDSASNQIKIVVKLSEEHKKAQEDWYEGNNSLNIVLRAIPKADLTIHGAMGKTLNSSNVTKVKVFKGETIALKVQARSSVDYTVSPVKVSFVKRNISSGESQPGTKNLGAIDMYNPQTVMYEYKAGNKGTYYVDAYIDPEDIISEEDENNNKHTFEITVVDDLSKYASTSHINTNNLNGSETGNSKITIASEYGSVTPAVVLKRKDKEYIYDEEEDTFKAVWGPEYDYRVELPEASVNLLATEEIKFKEILFKSKYTTDRWANNKDRDIIDSQGYVNLLGGTTDSEKKRIQSLAKVKAGYGFELQVKTSYTTDLKTKYDKIAAQGSKAKIGPLTVAEWTNNKVRALNQGLPGSSFRATSNVTFFPRPQAVTVNAKDQVLSVTMPDLKTYKTTDVRNQLIEVTSGGTVNSDIIYSAGTEWLNQFTLRSSRVGEKKSRLYYLTNEVPNGDYYIRIGTSKFGVGGIVNAPAVYEDNKSNPLTRAYAATDIKINVYGGREEDLTDN